MKIVKAHEVKRDIMSYAFFERGHMAVVTEGLHNADVLSIAKNRYAVEFEIKVSKSDLDKELAAIEFALMKKQGLDFGPAENNIEQEQLNLKLAGLKEKAGGWSKVSKHKEYVDPKAFFENQNRAYYGFSYMPNYFYLVVPNKLVDYAKEKTVGTGYGVIAYDGCRSEGDHYAYFVDDVIVEDRVEGAVWRTGAPCSDRCIQEVSVKSKARLLHKEPVDEQIIMMMLSRACTENIRMMQEIITLNKWLKDAEEKAKNG